MLTAKCQHARLRINTVAVVLAAMATPLSAATCRHALDVQEGTLLPLSSYTVLWKGQVRAWLHMDPGSGSLSRTRQSTCDASSLNAGCTAFEAQSPVPQPSDCQSVTIGNGIKHHTACQAPSLGGQQQICLAGKSYKGHAETKPEAHELDSEYAAGTEQYTGIVHQSFCMTVNGSDGDMHDMWPLERL